LLRKTIADPIKGFEELPSPITTDYIVKISPDGKEEMQISVMDAFKDTPYEHILFHSDKGDGDDSYDFFHTNAIDVLKAEDAAKFPLFKAGQILISIRSFSTIAVIDPNTKKIVWAYHGFWRYQHAAHFLPNGNILLLDNQGMIDKDNKKRSRVIELNPNTLGVEWSYVGTDENPFNTQKVGRLQRLPNGNTLINESQKGRIFEVTAKGDIVWSYKIKKGTADRDDYTDATFNSIRYSADQLPFLKEIKKEEKSEPAVKAESPKAAAK
jgi:hypothetical protein